MIAWLEGVLRDKTPTRLVVDVQGVGYELLVPLSTYTALPDEGKTVALHVHTAVRDDAIQLFGFASTSERDAFELLLRASRVGPKLAQTVLSGISAAELVRNIVDGNHKALRKVPGVGAKMAERITVELRDRAGELATASSLAEEGTASGPPSATRVPVEAVSALINLGYPRNRAEQVIESSQAEVGEDVPLESLIREALRRLSQ